MCHLSCSSYDYFHKETSSPERSMGITGAFRLLLHRINLFTGLTCDRQLRDVVTTTRQVVVLPFFNFVCLRLHRKPGPFALQRSLVDSFQHRQLEPLFDPLWSRAIPSSELGRSVSLVLNTSRRQSRKQIFNSPATVSVILDTVKFANCSFGDIHVLEQIFATKSNCLFPLIWTFDIVIVVKRCNVGNVLKLVCRYTLNTNLSEMPHFRQQYALRKTFWVQSNFQDL